MSRRKPVGLDELRERAKREGFVLERVDAIPEDNAGVKWLMRHEVARPSGRKRRTVVLAPKGGEPLTGDNIPSVLDGVCDGPS